MQAVGARCYPKCPLKSSTTHTWRAGAHPPKGRRSRRESRWRSDVRASSGHRHPLNSRRERRPLNGLGWICRVGQRCEHAEGKRSTTTDLTLIRPGAVSHSGTQSEFRGGPIGRPRMASTARTGLCGRAGPTVSPSCRNHRLGAMRNGNLGAEALQVLCRRQPQLQVLAPVGTQS